jgi:predicted nucleic acid-binding protein
VAERPAVNTSPLVFLTRIQQLDLLRHFASAGIVVPAAVATEIHRRGPDDVTARTLRENPWINVVEPPPVPAAVVAWDLGPGESSVLAWAGAFPGTEAIVDDLAARRCAASLGIPVRGTLGLVLAAKRRGALPAARPVVEALRAAGMWLADDVVRRALAMVGE